MNCQMFSELACELARDQMMDAGTRAQALAHSRDCANCAMLLKAQQRLTSDLRELVSATKDANPSPVVWENLSAAFDNRAIAHITTNRRRRIYAAGAIAAMLILTFAVIRLARQRQPHNVEGSIAATFTTVPLSQTSSQDRDQDINVAVDKKAPVRPHRHSVSRQRLAPEVNQPKEIATDFISLTYGDTEVGSDAQMVRVELPRSAMAGFGLPVNMDRADQRVKADVLLGADGLARAIRFVQ
jgi:hypothetical protein